MGLERFPPRGVLRRNARPAPASHKISRKAACPTLRSFGRARWSSCLKSRTEQNMKRILVVNVNWLGDVLFSTPLIRAIREKFPGAYIACMIVPRCREVLELNPRLNEIIVYDEEHTHKGVFGKLKFISHLRSKRFDAAIIMHRSFTKALLVFLAGIPQRIGYRTKNRAFLLTKGIEPPPQTIHRVDYFLNLGKALGIDTGTRDYEFFISEENRKRARALLDKKGVKDSDFLVVINPGGNWEPKRWPKENFAKLADELVKRVGAKVIITGSKKDIALAEDISSMAKAKPILICGETSLKELASVFERANIVIANDSGPMHIAVSMRAKTIALFGPTSPEITGPIGKGRYLVLQKQTDCEIPCYDLSCADYKCMNAIKVEDLIEAVGRI